MDKTMDELYLEYGKLMVEIEIKQSQAISIKQQIANGLNGNLTATGGQTPEKE